MDTTFRPRFSAIQHRFVGQDTYGKYMCEVRVRWWHPGAWLHIWRMRRAEWVECTEGEVCG